MAFSHRRGALDAVDRAAPGPARAPSTTAFEITFFGAEHVHVRALVLAERAPDRVRDRVALDRQRGVAGAGGPGGGRHRPLGLLARVAGPRSATGRPRAAEKKRSTAAARSLASSPSHHRGLVRRRAAPRRRRSGSPVRPSRGPSPRGFSWSSVSAVTAGRPLAVASAGSARRSAGRRAPRRPWRTASRRGPRAPRRSAGRPRRWRGTARSPRPAASAAGVRAGHANRVAGGRVGEAELLGGLLVARSRRRAPPGSGSSSPRLQPASASDCNGECGQGPAHGAAAR